MDQPCLTGLLDVLCQHVCSKLQAADIQHLSQTCKAFRQSLLDRLPASTWSYVAAQALKPNHPTLSLPGSEIRSYLERVARTKQTLSTPEVIGELCFFGQPF